MRIRDWTDEVDELPTVEHIRKRPKDEPKQPKTKGKKKHDSEAAKRKEFIPDD